MTAMSDALAALRDAVTGALHPEPPEGPVVLVGVQAPCVPGALPEVTVTFRPVREA